MLTPTINEKPSLERIEMLLLELGAQPHLNGFLFLARTIQYYCSGRFKQISPIADIVAEEYHTTAFSVKRMIGYVINNADNMLKRIVKRTGVPISKSHLTIVRYMPDSRADEFEKKLAAEAAATADVTRETSDAKPAP